jgi:hypothetical protein
MWLRRTRSAGTLARLCAGRHRVRGTVGSISAASDAQTAPAVIAGGLAYLHDELGGRLVVRRPMSCTALPPLPVGTGHWNSPIVAKGRIILPACSYASSTIGIYHLPRR